MSEAIYAFQGNSYFYKNGESDVELRLCHLISGGVFSAELICGILDGC